MGIKRQRCRSIERDLTSGDHNLALANLAELAEIALRLWNNLAKGAKQSDSAPQTKI